MAVATAKVARHMHGLKPQAPILMKKKKKENLRFHTVISFFPPSIEVRRCASSYIILYKGGSLARTFAQP